MVSILYSIGIILRLIHYLGNRSLRNDEAALTLNILRRSFFELLQPLDFMQIAPPGFLWILKLLTELFGGSEYALRLIPLAGSIAALYLMYRLLVKLAGQQAAFVGLVCLILSKKMIFAAADIKQYSTDAAIILWLYVLVSQILARWDSRSFTRLTVAGAAVVWVSYPSVFILASIGLTLGIASLAQGNRPRAGQMAFAATIWLTSFAASLLVTSAAASDVVPLQHDYWARFFAPFPITSVHDITWYGLRFFRLFKFGFANLPAIWIVQSLAVLLFLAGSHALWQNQRKWFFLLLSPFVITLIASGFRLYPFGGRPGLFFVPLILILIALGIEQVRQTLAPPYRWAGVTLAGVLILSLATNTLEGLRRTPPFAFGDIKPVLHHVGQSYTAGDQLYVYAGSKYPFEYYAPRFGLDHAPTTFLFGSTADEMIENFKSMERPGRAWFIFSQLPWESNRKAGEAVEMALHALGRKLDVIRAIGASGYLYGVRTIQRKAP